MIKKYHNYVEASELADLPAAERIVATERAAGNHRFSLKAKGELAAEMELESMMDSIFQVPTTNNELLCRLYA